MENSGVINDKRDITTEQPVRMPGSRGRRGSSLVEMLIAILVLGVVLISMVGMFAISRSAIYTKEDETAYALALRYMEELEKEDFAILTADGGFSRTWPDPKFTIRAEVTGSDEFLANVAIEVAWTGAAMGRKTLTMERVISAVGHRNVGEKK